MIKLWNSFNRMMKSSRLHRIVRIVIYEENKTDKVPTRESVV